MPWGGRRGGGGRPRAPAHLPLGLPGAPAPGCSLLLVSCTSAGCLAGPAAQVSPNPGGQSHPARMGRNTMSLHCPQTGRKTEVQAPLKSSFLVLQGEEVEGSPSHRSSWIGPHYLRILKAGTQPQGTKILPLTSHPRALMDCSSHSKSLSTLPSPLSPNPVSCPASMSFIQSSIFRAPTVCQAGLALTVPTCAEPALVRTEPQDA